MRRVLLAPLVLLAWSSSALGQEIDIVDIVSGEGDPRTNTLLNMIFGPLWPGDNEQTLISILITDFNILFFALGALLLMYNVLVGTMESAHDGEVLGHRHSSLWVPIRTLVAGALLIPIPATGYSGVQHGAAYLVNVGTGISTFFWEKTVNLVINDHMPIVGTDFEMKDGQFVQAVWRMELCRAVYNTEIAKGGGELSGIVKNWRPAGNGGNLKLSYDMVGYQGACGTITLPDKTEGFDRIAEAAGKSYSDYVQSMRDLVQELANDRVQPVADVLAQAVSQRTGLPEYQDLAADLEWWRTAHASILEDYIGSSQLQSATQDAASDPDSIRIQPVGSDRDIALSESMISGGWIQAGFYYQLLGRFSSDASAVASGMPTATPGGAIGASSDPSGRAQEAVATQYAKGNWYLFGSAEGDAAKFLEQIVATYNGTVEWWNESVERSGIRAFTNERVAFADNAGDIASYIPSAGNLFESLNYLNPTAGVQDPMIGLIIFGNQVAFYSAVIILALSALAIVPWGGQVVIAFATFLGWIVSGIAVGGNFLAFVLPLMPTFIWIIGVTAFFLLIIEAIFAGPLWAIAHLSMEGHGMAGQQARRGYVFLLALVLTPVLMLIGLFVGMIIFRITGILLNQGIYYALTSTQVASGDGFTQISWIFGVFVVLLFMIMIYLVVIERSFSLIAEFPGRVFRWFDHWAAQDLDTHAAARVNAAGLATGAASDRIQGSSGTGLARFGNQRRQARIGKE